MTNTNLSFNKNEKNKKNEIGFQNESSGNAR